MKLLVHFCLFVLVAFCASITWAEDEDVPNSTNLPENSVESTTSSTDADPAANWEELWQAFKQRHGKTYHSFQEEIQRKRLFQNTKQRVDAHNKRFSEGNENFQMALNELSDMSDEERKRLNGIDMSKIKDFPPHAQRAKRSAPTVSSAPASWDWRQHGYVTPVKNQGSCGDCWAFSATGAIEGQHFKATGKLVSLSEQNLLDCSGSYGNGNCSVGGIQTAAFRYVACNGGIDTEASYNYTTAQGKCRYSAANIGATITGFQVLPKNDENALLNAVATVGPISIVFDVVDDFYSYSSGIYSSTKCSNTSVNHGMLIVGYDTDANGVPYWIVKNNWGTGWGQAGYVNIKRNADTCAIAYYSSYPTVNGTLSTCSNCQCISG